MSRISIRTQGIRRKLYLGIGLIFALMSVMAVGSIFETRYLMMEERKAMIEELTTEAGSILSYFNKRYESGELSLEDAQNMARDSLRSIRFLGDNYMFVYQGTVNKVLPTSPQKENTDLANVQDEDGKFVIQGLNKVAHSKEGAGFYEYMWRKIGTDKAYLKLSYVKLFKPWDWHYGTGIYMDEINAQIQKKIYEKVYIILGFFVILSIILGVVALYSNKIVKTIEQAEKVIRHVTDSVLSQSEIIQTSATKTREISEQTTDSATQVSAGSEETSMQVASVASATEELSASIRDITTHTTRLSQEIVARANNETRVALKDMEALIQDSQKVGNVVGLIREIADQTNLLALNASIEAARAGDAGRGFAVVADEVKKLASQTAQATGEISSMVTSIQQNTEKTSNTIQSINDVLQQVDETSSSVANAVQQQGSATQDISRSLQEASGGVNLIASSITEVLKNANESQQQATSMQQISQAFIDLTKELGLQVNVLHNIVHGKNKA